MNFVRQTFAFAFAFASTPTNANQKKTSYSPEGFSLYPSLPPHTHTFLPPKKNVCVGRKGSQKNA